MKERDGLKGLVEVAASTAMVAEDAPVLESGDHVLDAGSLVRRRDATAAGGWRYEALGLKR